MLYHFFKENYEGSRLDICSVGISKPIPKEFEMEAILPVFRTISYLNLVTDERNLSILCISTKKNCFHPKILLELVCIFVMSKYQ